MNVFKAQGVIIIELLQNLSLIYIYSFPSLFLNVILFSNALFKSAVLTLCDVVLNFLCTTLSLHVL